MNNYSFKSAVQPKPIPCCQDFLLHIFFGFLLLACHSFGFSLETQHPRVFTAPEVGSHFGHQVCHFGPTQGNRIVLFSFSVLVTAPNLHNGTGGLYRCSYSSNQCMLLPVTVDPGIAFGLALACDVDQALVSSVDYDCSDKRR
ncbi:Integrin alpha-M [Labeo rohita]|uniref:Integrin alpha-M n=1 Tax=Labeo rohita TaxID=84645 RepID=A0ABQ8MNR7_LABRO|nr:Integrin alpha-M [Labeo rohita]